MSTVDNNPIAVIRKKCPEIAAKRAENKQKLINQILFMISTDMYNYEGLCLNLAEEALQTKTQKELKEYL
jgi:hypothetical protein